MRNLAAALGLGALALLLAACSTSSPGARHAGAVTSTSSTTSIASTTTIPMTTTTSSTTTTSEPPPTTTTTAAPLDWTSPPTVTSGIPIHVASISPCPTTPTAGDTVQVMISLGQGASNALLDANSDGSWSGDVTFTFTALPPQTTIGATCRDFFGNGSNPYAEYQLHGIEASSG